MDTPMSDKERADRLATVLSTIKNQLSGAPMLWERNLNCPERKVNQAIGSALSTIEAHRFLLPNQAA